MAKSISQHTLWLPGLDPAFPAPPSPPASAPASPGPAPRTATVQPVETPPATPRSTWRPGSVPKAAPACPPWPRLTVLEAPIGPVAKFEANLAAIEVLDALRGDHRPPTSEERAALLRYTGWGGIPASFNHDGREPAWTARAARLQQRLDDADYQAARASVTSGHYTDLPVAEAMWQAVAGFGFAGGRILEPAAGIGHFIGAMPAAIAAGSRVTAIEIDRVSGRILQALYAGHGVDVHIAPFEKTPLAEGWFDLVIGNVPFGHHPSADASNRPYAGFSLHDYFLGRALDLVRPGGLVCFVTSTHTLESTGGRARTYAAGRAELLGALRLPQGAFARIAGTQVQADILFLRRRDDHAGTRADWLSRVQIPAELRHPDCREPHLMINQWFARHPDCCIGRIRRESNGYSHVATAVFDGDLAAELPVRIAQLPRGVYQAPLARVVPNRPRPVAADPGDRPGSYRLHQGQVHRVDGAELVNVHQQLKTTQRSRITGLCTIRDQVRALLDAQLTDADDASLARLRAALNGSYDRFVARCGPLSSRANALAFRRDPSYPLLLSLEHYDEDTGTARKAAIFSRRTLSRITAPVRVGEPAEALAASMQWRGRVDPAYMARLLDASAEDVLHALAEAGLIFRDPVDEHWKPADEYLSGDVKRKLRQARLAGAAFAGNVQALDAVQPEDLPPASIDPRLGAVWIPAREVECFIREVLALEDCEVAYSAEAGAWSVRYPEWKARQNVRVTQEFGTTRMNAIELVQCALNVQVPTVRDRDPVTERYQVNPSQTLAAREKLGLIKDRFAQWAFADAARREGLCRIYNDTFNATRPRRYDGSHLTLPGFSQCFELHPHQRDAIWRIVQSGNTGLFHAVGAGKTAVCVAASMELRRLGFVSKPCHVVPNHMLAQYTAEFVRLYPNASVLMAGKDDLQGDRRRELAARIATGDWDAVVLTHSSFERIRLSPGFSARFIEAEIREIELAIRSEQRSDGGNRIVKHLEVMKKSWAARLERLSADAKKDDLVTWEQLGIDSLFVDEAHLFKVRRVKLHA